MSVYTPPAQFSESKDSLRLPRSRDLADVLHAMLVIRRFEEQVLALRAAGEISGSVHPCVGQEVVPAAVVATLGAESRILATYRGHGWALAAGAPLDAVLAELMGRAGGVNGGRGGSAYLTAPEYGFVGENSIVAAGLPIANGVAMALAARGSGGIAVVSFGDGATNQGAAHEALVFAVARALPVLFVCENNGWSEMTPISQTVPRASLAGRAAAYGMPARRVSGTDVAALLRESTELQALVAGGGGPAFLEVAVPRLLGHYNADIEHYRSKEDRAEHVSRDPIAALRASLLAAGTVSESGLAELEASASELVSLAQARAAAMPQPDPSTATLHVVGGSAPRAVADPGAGDSSAPTELKYGLAINRALTRELEERDNAVVFGEDIATAGGTFGVTRNLLNRFGDRRVFDTPIAEAAILGAATGSSLEGLLPIVEIMWSDFLFVAFDQIINQVSNVRYISQGKRSAPIVVRMQQGITPGSCAQHSQSIEALLAHIPGIKVGMPSTPQDAYAMTRAAVADPDPVILIEARELYLNSGPVHVDGLVERAEGARLRRGGTDALIVTWGRITHAVLDAAAALSAESIEVSVLDLRWIAPLDEPAIVRALADSGGRLLIVHEANISGGFGAEVAARVAERHFDLLAAPPRRLGLPNTRVPAAPVLQAALVPGADDIAQAVRQLVGR
jgi:2-oxoisovalerate dehydrogenase E1 component